MLPYETAQKFPFEKTVVIDTETTGLDPESNEILSLSIVDINGSVLFDHLIKPQHRKRWPKAQEIHGISPADVKDEKTLQEYMNEISPYFDGSYLIVGYNVKFDISMLKAGGVPTRCVKTFDVMREVSKVHGEPAEWKSGNKWIKLTDCANMYGYPSFDAHGSLADARATAFCYQQLMNDKQYEEYAKNEVLIRDEEEGHHDTSTTQSTQSGGAGCGGLLFAFFVLLLLFILLFVFMCSR